MNYKEYEELIKDCKEITAEIRGTQRGGYLLKNGMFAYCAKGFNVTDNFTIIKG